MDGPDVIRLGSCRITASKVSCCLVISGHGVCADPAELAGDNICLPPLEVPFYFIMRQDLFDSISDTALTLVALLVTYWYCRFYFTVLTHLVGQIPNPRIRRVTSRNRATRSGVFWAVILQCIIQTVLHISAVACRSEVTTIAKALVYATKLVLDA